MPEPLRGWTIGPTAFVGGSQGILTLPAPSAGIAIVVTDLFAKIVNYAGAVASSPTLQLLDGTTVIDSWNLTIQAVSGTGDEMNLSGLNITLTPGNALTWQFNVAIANAAQSLGASGVLL